MRRIFTCILAACAIATAVVAQPAEVFRPHFFGQLQAGVAYTVGEASEFGKLVSPAAAVNVGYRFSPFFGLRVGGSGWQGRGTWVNGHRDYKFNYVQGNVDAMLSLSNLLCGASASRTLDVYLFAGGGLACGFHNTEAVDMDRSGMKFEKLWTGKHLFPAGRAGLGMDINLSRCFALNIEVNANLMPDNFNSKRGSSVDWQFNALAGVTYSFGGRSRAIEPEIVEFVVAEPQPAPLPAPEPEPEPAPTPAPVVAPVPEPMTQDIFFRINSSAISAAEQVKVDALANYLKNNPTARVTITGYADRATGYPAYNMKISQARAQRVATALEAAGIAADRITLDAKGDTVQPYDTIARNRVAIAVTE
ncbi:MAG: OmpA family protein [Bacteroidales bacterium]|nr:OmpA family protein [Bacteroidales bacterium]